MNREKQLPLDDAVQITREVADALGSAHSHGVVHRDIKPENILLEEGHAVVADFGIARAISEAGGDKLTETGLAVGTPAYMSPEQAGGEPQLDGRSDIYSLGCVVYEMLAGEPPFTGPSAQALLARHSLDPVPSLRTVRATIPEGVQRAVERALGKVPADRFATAQQFFQALDRASTPNAVAKTETRPATPSRRRLAVLPLGNLMNDPEQEYFVDGMHDALIAELARAGVAVIARTSVVRYRDTEKPVREIARELDVGAVIEGSVFRAGDSVRIQVQLIDAGTEEHLWAQTYDSDLRDVLSLHSRVARDVARQVQVALTPEGEARRAGVRPVNPQAYDAYLKGQFYLGKRTQESLEAAMEQFRCAIEIDPAHAAAHAGVALVYVLAANHNYLPPSDALPGARAAALRAIELDEMMGETHVALAGVRESYERNWPEAGREWRLAIALNPNYPEAYGGYAYWLAVIGRYGEAIAQQERAVALDPLSVAMKDHLGRMYHFARQYNRAIEQFKSTLELDPNCAGAYWCIGVTRLQQGMLEEAVAALQRAAALSGAGAAYMLAHAYALAGRRVKARKILEEIEELSQQKLVSAAGMALVYAALRDKDRAFALLDEAYDNYDGWLCELHDPVWDLLRDDPRFHDLRRRMNLPE